MLGKLTFLFILLHVASLTFAYFLFDKDLDEHNFLNCIRENAITDKDKLLTLPEVCKPSFDKFAVIWRERKKREEELKRRNAQWIQRNT